MYTPNSLRGRVFYLIRFHDIELAEDFLRRCPDVQSINTLNQFFHRTFNQYTTIDTSALRQALHDQLTIDEWLKAFEALVLPTMRKLRFPPCLDQNSNPFYQIFTKPDQLGGEIALA